MTGLRSFGGVDEHDGQWLWENWCFQLRLPRARKDYSCDACDEDIPKGSRHVVFTTTNIEGPGFEHWRLHIECYRSNQPMFGGTRPEEHYSEEEDG